MLCRHFSSGTSVFQATSCTFQLQVDHLACDHGRSDHILSGHRPVNLHERDAVIDYI